MNAGTRPPDGGAAAADAVRSASAPAAHNPGAERIAAAFASSGKRAALMPYLMAGFPDLDASAAIGAACEANGADVLELGVPFSDPLADGPQIHAAASAALAQGTTVSRALDVGARLAELIPVVVMCYANPILLRGYERFAQSLAKRGIAGLIVPDLPLEEAPEALAACDAAGVALVPLVAPTTPPQRLQAIGPRARGFLYTVSVTGTTGERGDLDAGALIARAKAATDVPVALGFGISTAAHAAAAADAGADGVIVGSRLVRAAADAHGAGTDPAVAVGAAVAELDAGLAVA